MNKCLNILKEIKGSNICYSPVGLDNILSFTKSFSPHHLPLYNGKPNYFSGIFYFLNRNYKLTPSDFIKENSYFFYDPTYEVALQKNNIDDKLRLLNTINPQKIREIVAEDTGGLITDFPTDEDLGGDVKFAIINNLLLNLKWQTEFKLNTNNNLEFKTLKGESQYPDYLTKYSANYSYFESELLDILEIPTENIGCKFYAFLPKALSLDGLIQGIETYYPLINSVKQDLSIDVDILLPKFDITQEIDFKEILIKNGITSCFEYSKDWNFIDWDKLLPEAVIKIDKLKQKSRVIINEKEIKAASTTYAGMAISGCAIRPRENKKFVFDRPFLYAIVDKSIGSDLPLFIGTVDSF